MNENKEIKSNSAADEEDACSKTSSNFSAAIASAVQQQASSTDHDYVDNSGNRSQRRSSSISSSTNHQARDNNNNNNSNNSNNNIKKSVSWESNKSGSVLSDNVIVEASGVFKKSSSVDHQTQLMEQMGESMISGILEAANRHYVSSNTSTVRRDDADTPGYKPQSSSTSHQQQNTTDQKDLNDGIPATIPTVTSMDSKEGFTTSDPFAPTPRPAESSSVMQATSKKRLSQQGAAQKVKRQRVVTNLSFREWKIGDRYELIRVIGHGSYGEVAQARDKFSTKPEGQNYVAIKRIPSAFEHQLDCLRIYREIHILRHLRGQDCIINLTDIITPDNYDSFKDLYLVFEYVDTDLYKLIMSPQYLTTEHIQTFIYQIVKGLKQLHSANIIHRDLKPANILLNEDCSLKICDFGLARVVARDVISSSASNRVKAVNGTVTEALPETSIPSTPSLEKQDSSSPGPIAGILKRQLTKHVVTRWYRAPELILIQPYTSSVDIWSLGCILAELLSMQKECVANYHDRRPLFPGGSCYPLSGEGALKMDDRLDQLNVIFSVIGTPSVSEINELQTTKETKAYLFKYVQQLKSKSKSQIDSMFAGADADAVDLLKKMLQFDPSKRCTVNEAINHEFLRDLRAEEPRFVREALVLEDVSGEVEVEKLKRLIYKEVLWYKQHQQ